MRAAALIALVFCVIASGARGFAQEPAGAEPATEATAAPPAPPPPERAPDDEPSELPPGHPPAAALEGPRLGGQMTREGFFRPAPDQVIVDKSLPAGTIRVLMVDAQGEPIPEAPITLHVLHSSVTQGESRERLEAVSGKDGTYVFADRSRGSGISYQVKSLKGPAVFASQPFGLRDEAGVTAILHVYEPIQDLARAALIAEGVILLDIKEDNIALNHLVAIHNVGMQAFVSDGMTMPLPPNASAFQQQESMGEQAVVQRGDTLALVGTFPPGTTQLTYRYQVPLEGSSTAAITIPMPPRLVSARVVVGASESMALTVAGFPPAQKGRWHDGKRVLETSGRPASATAASIRSSVVPTMLEVTITGIPTPGWGRWAAAALAFAAAAAGAGHFYRAKRRSGLSPDALEDLRAARAQLLEEMALLERARLSGEVGPRSYERLRLALVDALARVMAQLGIEPEEEAVPAGDYRDGEAHLPARKRKRRKKRVVSA